MDHGQGAQWGRDDVDHALGSTAGAGMPRLAHVLATTRLPEGYEDVTVTVRQGDAMLVLGGFETYTHAQMWARAVAQVAADEITTSEKTHATPTEADLAVHHDLTSLRDLAGVLRGIWTRIGTTDIILRPQSGEYELVMTRGGTYRHAGRLTADQADDIRFAVLALSNAGTGSTEAAFDADGCVVRVSIAKSASGFRMNLRPIRVDRN